MVCMSRVQAHTTKLMDKQERDWKAAAARQREEMHFMRGKIPFA